MRFKILLCACVQLLLLVIFVGCSNLSLKKNVPESHPVRLGVIGFKITAPVKLKDIHTPVEGESKLNLESEIARREREAKTFFIQYMNSYYKNVTTVDIPAEKVSWGKEMKIPKEELRRIREEYGVDALVLGEVPWYGKTNIIWPIIGLTTDIAVETLVIGYVTKWNPTILLANLGWELVTNTPLWFGGSYLFGQAYKPVTIETKLYKLNDGFKEMTSDFEVTKSRHMLEKYPKKERKKIQNQLDSSLKKALKEIAIELGSE